MSWLLIGKVLLMTTALLVITYVVLRWYARRIGRGQHAADRPELQCTSVLRLSAKTSVYLLRSNQSEVLVTESATGISVTILPATSCLNATLPNAPITQSR